MKAIYMMLLAAFIWSLYPTFVLLSEGLIGPMLFVVVIHISCGIFSLIASYYLTKYKADAWHNLKYYIRHMTMDHWMYLGLIGIFSTLFNICFVVAMGSVSKFGAAIIIELWPLIAMFLSPLLISKDWLKVRFSDYIAGLIALLGVAIIMVSDQDELSLIFIDYRAFLLSDNFSAITGLFVAFIGSICLAASIVLGAEVSNVLSRDVLKEKKFSLNCSFMGEVVRRIVALPPSLLLLFIFQEDFYYTGEGMFITICTGILVFALGSAAITISLMEARSSTVNMVYYISPVLAVIWLYFLGAGELNMKLVIGGALVILANLMVIQRNKVKKVKIKG